MRYALLFLLAFGLFADEPKPTVSELDREKLKRIQLQMELLQKQIDAALSPILQEQAEILDRVCKASNLDRADCEVNIKTGVVTKKPEGDKK